MTFIPVGIRPQEVESRSILVVNDYPDADALNSNRKISRAHESVLEQALHMAGLIKNDITIANYVPDRINLYGLWKEPSGNSKGYLLPEARIYTDSLLNLIEQANPKVIVTLGPVPTAALLNRTDYTKIRGYPFEQSGRIVIPTVHPKDMIWSNYIWRFYLSIDLQRAKDFAIGKLKICKPQLQIVDNLEKAKLVFDAIDSLQESKKRVSVDIEVSNYEVSCIAFAWAENLGFSIPFDERWNEAEEVYLWQRVATILENPNIGKVLQNGIFDVYFLIYKMQIYTKGTTDDTMIAHHIVYPDFLKGLGFLGSVYTSLTYWKDEVDFKKPLKEEA